MAIVKFNDCMCLALYRTITLLRYASKFAIWPHWARSSIGGCRPRPHSLTKLYFIHILSCQARAWQTPLLLLFLKRTETASLATYSAPRLQGGTTRNSASCIQAERCLTENRNSNTKGGNASINRYLCGVTSCWTTTSSQPPKLALFGVRKTPQVRAGDGKSKQSLLRTSSWSVRTPHRIRPSAEEPTRPTARHIA